MRCLGCGGGRAFGMTNHVVAIAARSSRWHKIGLSCRCFFLTSFSVFPSSYLYSRVMSSVAGTSDSAGADEATISPRGTWTN